MLRITYACCRSAGPFGMDVIDVRAQGKEYPVKTLSS
jgi:hypothetical protein